MSTVLSPLVSAIPGFCQPVSSMSHLAAAGVALIAAVPLIRLGRGSAWRQFAVAVYAVGVVTMFAVSGSYHLLARGCAARSTMQRLDHYAIWLLIAGTFTVVHGVMCRGLWRSGMLAFIWSYAAVGVLLQMYRFDIFSGPAGLFLYLGLGWVGVVSVVKVGRQIGFRAMRPVLYAGLFFSAGAVFEAFSAHFVFAGSVGPHELFHVAVILGVALHWRFVRSLLVTHAPQSPIQSTLRAEKIAVPAPAV
jgi:channel protein (hemolysin III family)